MAKFDIKSINYITCGKKQNSFNIEYKYTNDGMIKAVTSPEVSCTLSTSYTNTFFGDIGTNESMNQHYATNKASFYDVNGKMIIHGLYNLNKTKLRSTATKKGTNAPNIDVYVPAISNDFIGTCQLQSYSYSLSKETSKNPIERNIVFNSNMSVDSSYHYVLSSGDIKTYMYPVVKDLTNDVTISTYQLYVSSDIKVQQNNDLSNTRLESIFSPARNLNGIGYNYIIEMPLGTIYNNYENGYIQCDMAVTKTPHNHLYDISISSDNFDVNDCREYININACGDIVYLTYRDNVNYINNKKIVTYHDNLDLEYDQLEVDVLDYYKKKNQEISSYSYQHVEVIESINRYDGSQDNAIHKSSMFSLRLNDTGLNNSTISETTKKMLRRNISNNIRKIAEKICPANTQLFNVYFEGQ